MFNQSYGAAIRAVREASDLAQTGIQGLTDRHLRRVEHGQLSATRATLSALASAHQMSLNDYLDEVAKHASS